MKILIIILSLILISCKDSSNPTASTNIEESDTSKNFYEWDGSECSYPDIPKESNRLVVFGGSMAFDVAQSVADKMGKNLANYAQRWSTINCQLYAMKNANLSSDDTILYLIGETDMMLGVEFWLIDDKLKPVRRFLDTIDNEVIIIGNVTAMLQDHYKIYPPYDKGDAHLPGQYRQAIKESFDLFRYKHVDLYMLYGVPKHENYLNYIYLNDSGIDLVSDLIVNNY